MSFFIFLVFYIVIVTSTVSQPYSKPEFETEDFKENAEEYVRMHLVEELSRLHEIIETPDGKNWLKAWSDRRHAIVKTVTLNNMNQFFKNWPERLKRFQELQNEYFEKVVVWYYDKRKSSWPWPKLTFDPLQSKIVVHDNQKHSVTTKLDRPLIDPITNDLYIDYVLRFHRPFTAEELASHALLSDDVKIDSHYERKYNFVNKELISKLQRARYELLRKSLRGKHISYLDYRAALFQADRVTAYFDVLVKYNINEKTSSLPNPFWSNKGLQTLKILNDDYVYRKYLNFEDEFFTGNGFAGLKNRYDDPKNFGLDFEENSNVILGERFNLLRNLAHDMHDFGVSTSDFSIMKLEDLTTIELLLDRFKMLTFWYYERAYKDKQWINKKLNAHDITVFAIVPKNFEYMDHNDQKFDAVRKIMTEAKNRPILSFTLKPLFDSNDRFRLKMEEYIRFFKKGRGRSLQIHWTNLRVSQLINLVNSLNYGNLLAQLVPMSNQKLRTHTNLHNQQPHNLLSKPESKDIIHKNDEKTISLMDQVDEKKISEKSNIEDEIINIYGIPIERFEDNSFMDIYIKPVPETNRVTNTHVFEYVGNGGDGSSGYSNAKRPYSSVSTDIGSTSSSKRSHTMHH